MIYEYFAIKSSIFLNDDLENLSVLEGKFENVM
jgi:hypothetical protein